MKTDKEIIKEQQETIKLLNEELLQIKQDIEIRKESRRIVTAYEGNIIHTMSP